MRVGLEEFLKRIEQKPTNETLIDRFMTLVLEEESLERIFYLKKLSSLLLNSNPYAALKAAALELQEARKEKLTREYELGALKDVESCFLKLDKQENVQFIREEINKLSGEMTKSRTMPPRHEMPIPKPKVRLDPPLEHPEPAPRRPEATLIDQQRAQPQLHTQPDQRLPQESTQSSHKLKAPALLEVDTFSFVAEGDDELLPQITQTRQVPAEAPPSFAAPESDEMPTRTKLQKQAPSPQAEVLGDFYDPDANDLNYSPSHGERAKEPLDLLESLEVDAYERSSRKPAGKAKDLEFDADEEEDTRILPDPALVQEEEASPSELEFAAEGPLSAKDHAAAPAEPADEAPFLVHQESSAASRAETAVRGAIRAEMKSQPLIIDDLMSSEPNPAQESKAEVQIQNEIPSGVANFRTSAPSVVKPLLSREIKFEMSPVSLEWPIESAHWERLEARIHVLCVEQPIAELVRQYLGSRVSDRRIQEGIGILLQFLNAQPKDKGQKKLLGWIFEELEAASIQAIWASLELEELACSFYRYYLLALAKEEQYRRALNIIHASVLPGLDPLWYRVSYDLLLDFWERLGLRAWNWQEDEGSEAFCRRLQRREELRPLAIFS